MKNKLKYGLTLAALAFLVGCSDKESIQRPSIGSGPTVQDSSGITSSKTGTSDSNNSSDSGDSSNISSSESTSEIDPVELSNYQYYPLPDKTLAIAVGNNIYLEKLTLPEQYQGRKVTQIVENGFKDCKALREISIPSSVLTIGDFAFWGCSSLTGIVIPEGVTSIGNSVFRGCTSLTSVVIPNSVTNIGDYAFFGCSALASINVPKGVTTIGYYAFDDHSSLAIYCQAQSKPRGWNYHWNGSGCPVVWGCIRVGNQDCFEYAVTNIEGVESATITGYAGSDTSIVVPETIGGVEVTAIAGLRSFGGCFFLTSIVIPEGVRAIGGYAFSECTSLTGIAIPNSVRAIGDYAFDGCTSLTSVVIPDGVTNIGDSAFKGCSNLTICCKAKSEPGGWSSSWNPSYRPVVWGCIRAGNQDGFEYAVTSIEGVESAAIIGYTGSDASIVVPETIGGIKVTAIADSAFEGCASLTGIVIPESMTSIGNRAFYECTSLTSVVIPSSVTTIGAYPFDDCLSLTIYCEAQSKPIGWSDSWNYSNRPVVWGYSGNGISGSLNYKDRK